MDAKHTTFSVANIAPSPAKRRASRRVSEQLGLQNATNSPALDTSHKHKGGQIHLLPSRHSSPTPACSPGPARLCPSLPAERVKVYVRVRPTKSGCETPGQLHLHPDGCTLSTLREEHYASDFAFDQVCAWRPPRQLESTGKKTFQVP